MIRDRELMTVAELKRYMDRRFITKRGFRRELKRELQRELQRFPTKDDLRRELQNYATKEDLKAFATKDDLKALATKDELNDLRRMMLTLHHETMDLIREFRRDLLYIVDNHERRVNDLEAMHRV